MRILAVSDRVVKPIYSGQILEQYGDVDLVFGCGDLPYYYLEYITTMLPIPVAYVFGNHDGGQVMADGRTVTAPEGCVSLEDRTLNLNGLLVAGLGGSIRYKPRGQHQYTEGEMWYRIMRLAPRLMVNKLVYGRYLDILIAHSPPLGIHDGTDRPHTGFKSFLAFMRYFKPKYLLHGHKHRHRRDLIEQTLYCETMVVNVYPRFTFEWKQDE